MKKLLLTLCIIVISLSGCYVTPRGGHDNGYHKGDREHHEDGDRRGDDDRRRDNDREHH